jgi:hypothetical protein
VSQRNPQERFFVRDPDEIRFGDGAEEGPESAAELALRRHERALGRSLAQLTAAQEAYTAARKTKDRDPERWRQARSALERARVAHARLRKTHRNLQQAHQEEHDQQGGS